MTPGAPDRLARLATAALERVPTRGIAALGGVNVLAWLFVDPAMIAVAYGFVGLFGPILAALLFVGYRLYGRLRHGRPLVDGELPSPGGGR